MKYLRNHPVYSMLYVVFLALYLNIGWALGTYWHNRILCKVPQTFWQIVWSITSPNNCREHTLLMDQLVFMFSWPLLHLFFPLAGWLTYGAWLLLCLIFAGGLAKLLGIG